MLPYNFIANHLTDRTWEKLRGLCKGLRLPFPLALRASAARLGPRTGKALTEIMNWLSVFTIGWDTNKNTAWFMIMKTNCWLQLAEDHTVIRIMRCSHQDCLILKAAQAQAEVQRARVNTPLFAGTQRHVGCGISALDQPLQYSWMCGGSLGYKHGSPIRWGPPLFHHG